MKKIIALLFLCSITIAQWNGYTVYNNWINTRPINSIADWKANYNISAIDTGLSELVYAWNSTNGLYNFEQPTNIQRPLYDAQDKSIIFDGNNDYLFISSQLASIFNPDTCSFSIAIWVNGVDTTGGFLINKAGTARYSLRWIYLDPVVKIYAYLYDDSANYILNGNEILKFNYDSSWHLIVAVFDRNSGYCYGYLDGEYNEKQSISSLIYGVNPTGDLIVGSWNYGAAFFKGKISEEIFYKKVLNDKQIKRIYIKGRPR